MVGIKKKIYNPNAMSHSKNQAFLPLCLTLTAVALSTLGIKKAASQTVSFNVNSDMDFGIIEYETSHYGQIQLGTNGSVTIIGTGLTYDSGAHPAQMTLTANPASGVLEIKCEALGHVKNADGSVSLSISPTKISIGTGLPYASATECEGTDTGQSPAAVIDLSVTPTPIIYLGGSLIINTNELNNAGSTSYSSSNPSGGPIAIRVLYQ
jgi:hypothetical protein